LAGVAVAVVVVVVESLAKTDADEEIELSMKNLKQKKTLAQAILWFWVKLFVSNRESQS
jgi:hypothetical protein